MSLVRGILFSLILCICALVSKLLLLFQSVQAFVVVVQASNDENKLLCSEDNWSMAGGVVTLMV